MNQLWRELLIKPTQPIRDALQLINISRVKTVLVVNEDTELLGIVTDGDIRRGLLNNFSLEHTIDKVMSRHPVTVSVHSTRAERARIMKNKSILFLPLIKNNRVVGLETVQSSGNEFFYQNPVFIMAGGFGTRLKPLTENCPKPMLNIGGRPLLESVICSFKKAGFNQFYISTHYMAECIESHFENGEQLGVDIHYVHEHQPLGTAGALGLLPKDLPDLPVIVMNGDILTKVDFEHLLEFHAENNAIATMCVRDYQFQVPYGVISGDGCQITSIVEKPVQSYFVNAGIYVVNKSLVDSVPENYPIDMTTLLENQVTQGNRVNMFPIHEYWLDIGRMDDFKRAQVDILSLEMM